MLDGEGVAGLDCEEGVMSGCSSCEACSMYFRGSSRGEGLDVRVDHDMAYFAGSSDGWMSKLMLLMAEWICS